jgi:hypothetical protein
VHEHRDLNVRRVGVFGAGLLIVGILVHLVVGAEFFAWRRAEDRADAPTHPLATIPALPPAPRLEVASHTLLDALRRDEETLLTTYGWVDRAQGRARIPVSRAMDLLEKRGVPVRPGHPTAD